MECCTGLWVAFVVEECADSTLACHLEVTHRVEACVGVCLLAPAGSVVEVAAAFVVQAPAEIGGFRGFVDLLQRLWVFGALELLQPKVRRRWDLMEAGAA